MGVWIRSSVQGVGSVLDHGGKVWGSSLGQGAWCGGVD